MKKVLVLLIILFSNVCIGQDNMGQLKLHSVDMGLGLFLFDLNAENGGGVSFYANTTTNIQKNLLGVSYFGGAEIPIFGSSQYSINELSLNYGREIKPIPWFSAQGFAGIGFYNQNSSASYILDDNTISFPLKLNLKFWLVPKFAMGINSIYNVNSVNNFYSFHIIFTLSLEKNK